MKSFLFWVFIFSTTSSFAHSDDWKRSYTTDYYIGPEVYHIERNKAGGSKQHGVLEGVRLGMDRVKRCGYYWGVDYLWARGELNGGVNQHKLKSTLTDSNLEARLGYTFGTKSWRCATFTPFLGLGYFSEENNYKDPSPLPIHFKNEFGYVPFGFLSQVFVTPSLSLGLNFKVRVLVDQAVHVSNDPHNKDHIQHYKEEYQYRLDLPLTYFYCLFSSSAALKVVPFYEYRPYGYRVNFPFDFMETKFKIYGATLKIDLIY